MRAAAATVHRGGSSVACAAKIEGGALHMELRPGGSEAVRLADIAAVELSDFGDVEVTLKDGGALALGVPEGEEQAWADALRGKQGDVAERLAAMRVAEQKQSAQRESPESNAPATPSSVAKRASLFAGEGAAAPDHPAPADAPASAGAPPGKPAPGAHRSAQGGGNATKAKAAMFAKLAEAPKSPEMKKTFVKQHNAATEGKYAKKTTFDTPPPPKRSLADLP